MPLKITGKILDEEGLPLLQIAQISEVATAAGQTVSGNVWSDIDTGDFTFLALDPNSIIKVESHGYNTVSFKASQFPKAVKMQGNFVIEGNVTKKKDNTLAWVLGGIALLAVGIGLSNSKPEAEVQPKPVKKTPKPKTVTV